MEKFDGGPAFPALENWRTGSGMSLRDYLAAHAPSVPDDFPTRKQEIIEQTGNGKRVIYRDEPSISRLTRWRFEYADAMLKAREA